MACRETYRNQQVGTLLAFGRDRAVGYGVGRPDAYLYVTLVLDHGLAILVDDDTLAVVRIHRVGRHADAVIDRSAVFAVGLRGDIFANHAAALAYV